MVVNRKKVRYAYWLALAFIQNNAQAIVLSFILSIIAIVTIVFSSPLIIKYFTTRTEIIGISGSYNLNNLPVEVLSKISNGLLYINEKGEVIPLLAESWEMLDNGKEYRFHLKKDLLWNDGKNFAAADVSYQFKDVVTEVKGDNLLIYKLKEKLPIFPTFLTRPVMRNPLIGVAGLYKVEKLRVKAGEVQEIHLGPNKEGLPILIYKFYDTETKLLNAYKLGEITQMTTSKKNVAEFFQNWKNTEITTSIDYSRVMTLFFNMNHPLFKDEKDVRHAIAMAISDDIYKGAGEEALGPIQPTSWAYAPPAKRLTHDPELATKLLKNYTDSSESATLSISTFYDHFEAADQIRTDLENVGLTTKVEVLASDRPATFDLFLAQMQLPTDPDQYFFWHSIQRTGNITGYKNVRIDKLLEDGRGTINVSDRKKFYADFQRIIVDEMPADFLYYPNLYTIKRK